MKLRLLSSALTGMTLTLASPMASGPVTQTNWGAQTMPDAGPISIVTERTRFQCAPDTVGFWVDLSASTFDTPAPAAADVYDRRFHELEYFWTFGDPGEWSAPIKTLSAWKNRDFAYGAFVRHMYRAAGVYTASVMVVEPSSGKVATASIEVTVADADTVFTTTKTICVNQIGDSDFSAAPAGAQHFNADQFVNGDAIITAARAIGTGTAAKDRVRILFKAGWSGVCRVDTTNLRSLSMGTYGGVARATLIYDPTAPVRNSAYACLWHQGYNWSEYADHRYYNLAFSGGWNEQTTLMRGGADPAATPFEFRGALRYMVHNCTIDGFTATSIPWQPGQSEYSTDPYRPSIIHVDDCAVTNFGGMYPLFWAARDPLSRPAPTTSIYYSQAALTGCRIARHPDALTEFDDGQRALLRNKHCDFVHIRGNDMYNSDGVQACLRLVDTDIDGRTHLNVHTNALESVGLEVITVSSNAADRPDPFKFKATMINGLFDSNIIVGGWRTVDTVFFRCGGVTFRNNLCFIPNVPYVTNPSRSLISIANQGDTSVIVDWPSRIYNNTLVCDRIPSQNSGITVTPLRVINNAGAAITPSSISVTSANNVVHQPNTTPPQVGFAPLSTDILFVARNEGFRPIYHPLSQVLSAPLPNGGTLTFSCDDTTTYLPAGDPKHRLYRENTGGPANFTLTFGVNEVTVTNVSGVTWNAGEKIVLNLYNSPGNYRPKDTAYATGNVLAYAPLEGSAALGAALSEPSSERDMTGRLRPIYPSQGAWEMPVE